MSGLVTTPLNKRHAIANVIDTDLEFLASEAVPPEVSDRLPRTASPPTSSTAGARP